MVQRMKYQLVASSRSRATEIYRGEDGSLVQVEHYRSGVTDAWPVESIPESLTVRYPVPDYLMISLPTQV